MNIVVEGPDGAGKSTLCRYLSARLNRVLVRGEGPSKGPGELDQRIARMMKYRHVVFDRHPAVSGPIYQAFKGPDVDTPSAEMLAIFYGVPSLFVYCHPTSLAHEADSATDTPAYLNWLEENRQNILYAYETWALVRASFVYRAGDNMEQLATALAGALGESA